MVIFYTCLKDTGTRCYLSPGIWMSLRTVARNPKNLVKVIYNFFLMRYFDISSVKLRANVGSIGKMNWPLLKLII
jgi:hypothetical protein